MFRVLSNMASRVPTVSKCITNTFTNMPDVRMRRLPCSFFVSFCNHCIHFCLKKVWSLGKLNHVAIAVPNMEKAVAFYKNVLNATSVSESLVRRLFFLFINKVY